MADKPILFSGPMVRALSTPLKRALTFTVEKKNLHA